MRLSCTVVLFIACILSCKQAPDLSENKNPNSIELPTLPTELRNQIFQQCDYVDYIFYDLPFSMSQDTEEAIQSTVGFISDQPVSKQQSTCSKPLGRIIFQSKGEILAEADLFLAENCTFYLFMDGNQAKYANQMTNQAIGFYQNLIKQVTGS